MTELEEQSYIYLVHHLKQENKLLREEVMALRKLYMNKIIKR